AVIEGVDPHAWWQAAVRIEPVDSGPHTGDHVHGPLELLHQHDAEDHVGLVVTPGNAEPRSEANLDLGHVGQQDRHAVLLSQYDIAHCSERADDAEPAHIDRLLAHRDGAATDVGVPGRDCGHDLR